MQAHMPTSPSAPLVLVLGGTGMQGSACLKDLGASGRFRLRTITRSARSKVRYNS